MFLYKVLSFANLHGLHSEDLSHEDVMCRVEEYQGVTWHTKCGKLLLLQWLVAGLVFCATLELS